MIYEFTKYPEPENPVAKKPKVKTDWFESSEEPVERLDILQVIITKSHVYKSNMFNESC
jgi:hypothetical protein